MFEEIETKDIENLLLTEPKLDEEKLELVIERIRDKITICQKYKKLKPFMPQLKKLLETCLKLLEGLQKEREEKEKRERRIMQIERENEAKREQIRLRALLEETNQKRILFKLNAGEKNVFKKSDLSKNQIQALEKHGFSQMNEYSLIEHKYPRYLIKPQLNHSCTHTFLVWEAKKLIKTIKGVKNIQEHLTADADITFYFNNKKYALEIETGTLLGKKEQERLKVNYLNRKYPNRWMFIVSNKNLLPKYQELGFSTPRSKVLEKLKEMLKIY